MTHIIATARDFALKAHGISTMTSTASGLERPDVLHLQEVADLVWASGGTESEIAAAWLHDSIEDTSTTLEDVKKQFGDEIASIVNGLTDPKEWNGLPIKVRKPKQAERLRGESAQVRRVKIADQTSNVRSLFLDPKDSLGPIKCRHYIEGAKMLADGCKGASLLLDELFLKTYKEAKGRYKATFAVEGVVMRGNRKATALGFPTVNIPCSTDLPAGIYEGEVVWKGDTYPAAIYRGSGTAVVEAHLIDFSKDIYDEAVAITAYAKVRDTAEFDSEATLVAAIKKDVEEIAAAHKTY